MRRLDDNNRAKCEGKRGGSILLSVSVIRTYFFYSLDRRVENLKESFHKILSVLSGGRFKTRPPPDY
jgi:hypothetical protein